MHSNQDSEQFDVVIIGGGISGIGAACHLHQKMPHLTYVILEARASLGGTWEFYKYPGVRTDSNVFTMAYSFNPWGDTKSTASAGSVLAYMLDTAAKYDVNKHVRLNEKVLMARWDTPSNLWSVDALRGTGKKYTLTGNFIFMCTGYTNFNEIFTPTFKDSEKFHGKIVHPQTWPADLEYSGKEIVVIGSGATAITMVPALAESAGHVTMLQRSPSYIIQIPNVDPVATFLSKWLPVWWVHFIMRAWNIFQVQMFYIYSRLYNDKLKKFLERRMKAQLGSKYESKHFTPHYNVLEQRLCLSPDNDFTNSINKHGVTVVTDTIDRFTEKGILLTSGQELDADIIVTATGLNLHALGSVSIEVDGVPLPDLPSTCMYKGVMLCGVPNMFICLGYLTASWTLRVDVIWTYVCRMLAHMQARQCTTVRPRHPPTSMPKRSIFGHFNSTYLQRGFPKFFLPWRPVSVQLQYQLLQRLVDVPVW